MPEQIEEGPLKILHLEDDVIDAELVRDALEAEGIRCEIQRASSRSEFERALRSRPVDLILSDYSLPGFDGMSALALAREINPEAPFIFVSGTIGEERAVESLKNGAVDYVLKDRTSRLVSAVQRAYRESLERQKRHAIEEELRHRNELFRQITENVDDLIAVVDVQGALVFGSPSYLALFGVQAQSQSPWLAIVSEDLDSIRAQFREMTLDGRARRLGYRVLDPQGRRRHIESQWSAVHDNRNRVSSIVMVARDVTEREELTRTIREQAELLNEARDAIFVRDMNQRVTYWNKGAERLYGWTSADAIGRTLWEFLPAPKTESPDAIWRSVLQGGEWHGERQQTTSDGREITVAIRSALLRNARGEPIAVLDINSDISEEKRLQEQLLRSQRLDGIGALAGGIAHDLNNILAPILMAAELVRDRIPDEESRRMLDVAKDSARRGANLVKQILQFTRGQRGDRYRVNVSALVKEHTNFVRSTIPRAVSIEADIEPQGLEVIGDSTQIHQVLLNLCVNARDAMPKGGTMTITAKNTNLVNRLFPGQSQTVSGNFVEVTVADTGMGIPENVLPRIFEPFFSTKLSEKGTGLGLSTVAQIVQSHKGYIEVSSVVGRGSKFCVYLPSAPVERQMDSSPPASAVPKGNGEWILLIDDEHAVLEMTKGLLEAHGYNVMTAKDGSEGLSLFETNREIIRVVILDLVMPGLGGEQLNTAIRNLAPNSITMAMSGSLEEKSSGSPLPGFDAFLRKPCPLSDLLTTLATLLAR